MKNKKPIEDPSGNYVTYWIRDYKDMINDVENLILNLSIGVSYDKYLNSPHFCDMFPPNIHTYIDANFII